MRHSFRSTLVDTLRLFTVAVSIASLVAVVGFVGQDQPVPVALLGTSTHTATATATASPTPTATATHTLTPSPTSTRTPTLTPTPTITVTSAVAEGSAPTHTPSPVGTPTPTYTPTPTPTPVPRTVLASSLDLPDPTLAEDHFWFTRPFTDAFATWGSPYYPFGTNNRGQYLWHHGIDIQNPMETPILAVGDGLVVYAGPDNEVSLGASLNFFGQAVMIQHDEVWDDQPVFTLYGHVSKVLVQEGQSVRAGQVIAEVGQGGVALGPHLHLEVRVGGRGYADSRNPDLWVWPDPGYGVIAGRVIDAKGYMVPQQPIFLHRAEEPDQYWRQTFTYPDTIIQSDAEWGETFTFADIPVGGYVVKTYFDGRLFTRPITVTNQTTTFVSIEGVTPTPTPESTSAISTPQPNETPAPSATDDSAPTPDGA
jgi:murein DD-endopeptidase MepM/ murein hydrolase activator NlpD